MCGESHTRIAWKPSEKGSHNQVLNRTGIWKIGINSDGYRPKLWLNSKSISKENLCFIAFPQRINGYRKRLFRENSRWRRTLYHVVFTINIAGGWKDCERGKSRGKTLAVAQPDNQNKPDFDLPELINASLLAEDSGSALPGRNGE